MTTEGRIGRPTRMTRMLTLLFAVAAGAAVGNLYWAQPLLESIARAFGVATGAAGLLVTVTQVGYACGIVLLVPLGDLLNRRRLIPATMGLSALALTACAAAPNFVVLQFALACLGLASISGQLLVPLAGDLASDEDRGKVVGTVVSGLLTGILVSRTISGVVADAFGWRVVYGAAAVANASLAILLARALPHVPARTGIPYWRLLRSVFTCVRQHRSAQVTLVLGAISFAVFTMFWTALTFLLSEPPFSYSVTRIGLIGLVGLAGALAARRAGRAHDRGWSAPVTGAALGLALLSLVIAGIGARSIVLVLVAVLLIDIAIQAVNVLNQTRLFAIDPAARNRLNTAFVSCNFVAGAIGSSVAGLLWHVGGWLAVVLGASAPIVCALLLWFIHRGGALARSTVANVGSRADS